MKNFKRNMLVLVLLLMSVSSFALPKGWSFECSGSTGYYTNGEGSWVVVPNDNDCT